MSQDTPNKGVVPLEEMKVYLRVDSSEEDALITSIILAAEELVEGVLRRPLTDFCPLPQTVRLAVMFVVGSMFEGRQSQDSGLEMNEIIDTVKRMVFVYRKEVF